MHDFIYKAGLAQKIQAIDGLSNEEKSAFLELIRDHKSTAIYGNKPEDIK